MTARGLRTVRGVFGAYDGSLEVRAGGVAGVLTIEAASLDTANDRRDRHLRSPAFFDVEHHPRIVFRATAVTARDGGLTIEGQLAIGSSRVRLEIPVDVEQMADGALRLEAGRRVADGNRPGLEQAGDDPRRRPAARPAHARPRTRLTPRHSTTRGVMGDLQAIADRVEIEALRSEFTDALMLRLRPRRVAVRTRRGGTDALRDGLGA
jgi:hypothetical protein